MPRRRRLTRWEARGEAAWKWTLRLSALGAFFYVLVAHDGNVPLPVYITIGGFAGLPNIWSLQQMLNSSEDEEPGS